MVRTASTMLELGTPAPEFSLPDPLTGETVNRADFADAKAFLVAFLCNHCPYVKHIADEFSDFAADYARHGLMTVAINANDYEKYPADSPDKMIEEVELRGYTFPYLMDETQEVAKAYRAACTPDFFLFDGEGLLAYRGQFDASRPGNDVPVTGQDLRDAVDAVLEGRSLARDQVPSIGCNIKWKDGNAPDYFG